MQGNTVFLLLNRSNSFENLFCNLLMSLVFKTYNRWQIRPWSYYIFLFEISWIDLKHNIWKIQKCTWLSNRQGKNFNLMCLLLFVLGLTLHAVWWCSKFVWYIVFFSHYWILLNILYIYICIFQMFYHFCNP